MKNLLENKIKNYRNHLHLLQYNYLISFFSIVIDLKCNRKIYKSLKFLEEFFLADLENKKI